MFSTLGFTSVTFATGALAWFGPKYMGLAIELHPGGPDPKKYVIAVL